MDRGTSERLERSAARLLDVAARIGAPSAAGAREVGALLLAAAARPFDSRAGSRLNNDGSRLQLSLSCSPDGTKLRILADPCAGEPDRGLQRVRALAALDHVLGTRAPALLEAARATVQAVVPAPGASAGGVTLAQFTRGILWLGVPVQGPGTALYVDARPHGAGARDVVGRWLAEALPHTAQAQAVLTRLEPLAEVASVGLEGYAPADARAKIYLRLRDARTSLADLGVALLDAAPVHTFLRGLVAAHTVDREGLLLGVGFHLADGRLADAKVDVCGHCLPYDARGWGAALGRVTRGLGLAEPVLADVLSARACEVAFVGLGLDVDGQARVNVYLKADPARGPVTVERVRAALHDGVAALARLQRADGSWQDYDLPVGPSDQWVSAYVGHALAEVAGATGDAAAEAAARRAARALAHRTYDAGWGYNASTGPDCDSTAFALGLLLLLGDPLDPRDQAFLEQHWRHGGGFATYLSDSGWGAAHPDVTPQAFLALPPRRQQALRGELLAYLRRVRRDDGLWPSYWWATAYYATYQVLRLFARLGAAPPPSPRKPARLAPRNAFELACVLGIETLRDGGDRLPVALVDRLLGLQRLDGTWPGSENLRVTDDAVAVAGADATGRLYRDLAGTITTATALAALAGTVAATASAPRPVQDEERRERTMRRLFRAEHLEARFWQRGYVLVDLLDGDAVRTLQATFERYAVHHPEGVSPTIVSRDLAYRASVHRDVSAVLAGPLAAHLDAFRLCHAGFVAKSAASEASAMKLHQDPAWVEEAEHQGVTVWCPLVDTGEHNGWIGLVEGSHRVGPQVRVALPFAWPHLAEQVEERLTYLPVRAGQALLMHPACIHASEANASAEPRVVAVGMAAPVEAPLVYCHSDFGGDLTAIDVYAADDDFYQQHLLGTRPEGAPLRSFRQEPPPLTLADLDRLGPGAGV